MSRTKPVDAPNIEVAHDSRNPREAPKKADAIKREVDPIDEESLDSVMRDCPL